MTNDEGKQSQDSPSFDIRHSLFDIRYFFADVSRVVLVY